MFISVKSCVGFPFSIPSGFINVYIFVQQKAWTLWLYYVITPFKMKIIEKPHTVLLLDLWFLNSDSHFPNTFLFASMKAL